VGYPNGSRDIFNTNKNKQMKKTTLTILIETLEKEIKKTSLGGIKFYGLKEAQRLAKELLNDERKEIESAFNNGIAMQDVTSKQWYFMNYINND
tara:strand:- start:311 stop:592 length:282 start_codon:yes stop_codon:yes gene_type:complete